MSDWKTVDPGDLDRVDRLCVRWRGLTPVAERASQMSMFVPDELFAVLGWPVPPVEV